jgi:hypothetical protein
MGKMEVSLNECKFLDFRKYYMMRKKLMRLKYYYNKCLLRTKCTIVEKKDLYILEMVKFINILD